MSEVYFYHLTRQPIEQALPALLEKCLSVGWRVKLKTPHEDASAWLDEKLWVLPEDGFLPHSREGQDGAEMAPVVLSSSSSGTKGFDCVTTVMGADFDVAEVPALSRMCIMFNGNDDAELNHARQFWKKCSDAGLTAKYWSQETGSWQLKMG